MPRLRIRRWRNPSTTSSLISIRSRRRWTAVGSGNTLQLDIFRCRKILTYGGGSRNREDRIRGLRRHSQRADQKDRGGRDAGSERKLSDHSGVKRFAGPHRARDQEARSFRIDGAREQLFLKASVVMSGHVDCESGVGRNVGAKVRRNISFAVMRGKKNQF